MNSTGEIRKRIEIVRERIQKASARVGRDSSEIKLVLVTKEVPLGPIREAFEAGVRDFGENRVQEFRSKKPELPSEIRWHLVGHLQTNKVKLVLGEIHLLHSLDRMALAEEIQKQAEKRNLEMEALVQVNTTGETTKSGFSPAEMVGAGSPRPQGEATSPLHTLQRFNRIRIQGLMTIGPFTQDEKAIRASFRKLRELRDQIQKGFPAPLQLSMGMSSDFEIAIEEGATMVRIGTAVFGER